MLAKKFERLERTESDVFGQTAARSQMHGRHPGVLRVPDNRRDRADDEDSQQPIQTGSFEFLPEPGREREHEQDANDFERVCESRKKSETDQESSKRPPK